MSRAEDIFNKLIYFGEDAIDEYIQTRQTEELFLDFKQAVSSGKSMRCLHSNDRRNLGKAISAFGNSEGGVLIWGVECSRDLELGDVAKAKIKVENVHRFLSWLENAISGCTIPAHNKVRNHIISMDKNGDGYLATYIPKSEIAPLMTTTGSQIYIRSGSNNVPAPYGIIAGMFGKPPQPNIDLIVANQSVKISKEDDIFSEKKQKGNYIQISFKLLANNNSNTVAKEVYLSCSALNVDDNSMKIKYKYDKQLENIASDNTSINLITPSEMRVPPRAKFLCTDVIIKLYDDINTDLILDGVIGADNAIPKSFRIFVNKNDLRSFVAQAKKKNANLILLAHEFIANYLKCE